MQIKGEYDWLIVGAGLFGATCANLLSVNQKVLVIEKAMKAGGTCSTKVQNGIVVHEHGAHIFRTNDREVWTYVNRFADFNNFVNSPIAIAKGKAFNLPFNMNTFNQVFGTVTPSAAKKVINDEINRAGISSQPGNLEEHAISLVGKTLYEMFVKGYTEKQWGQPCSSLSPSIIRRIPVRYVFDNNYYDARYQGVPIGGYSPLIGRMLVGSDVVFGEDFCVNPEFYLSRAKRVIYTGPVDELMGFAFGPLEYRGLRFETIEIDEENHQGNAVINFCDYEIPYTRVIEHKHFEKTQSSKTIISYEYPEQWARGKYPYYPMEDDANKNLYQKYANAISKQYPSLVLGGRLGLYQYLDMSETIKKAMTLVEELKNAR